MTTTAAALGHRGRGGAGSGNPAGRAVMLGQGTERAVQVQATGLEPSTQKFAYQFWLYDNKGKARSLGAQVTDQNGTLQAIGNLPKGFEKYRYFDLSREPIGGPAAHSGKSVLRGRQCRRLASVEGNKKITRMGQVVLRPAGERASPAAASRGSSRLPGRARPSRPAALRCPADPPRPASRARGRARWRGGA